MGKIIAVTNEKGGVGKTTLCSNVGGALSEFGKETLLVDLDGQFNLTMNFLKIDINFKKTVFDLFTNEDVKVDDVICKTEFPNLYIIPSSSDMSSLDSKLAGEWDAHFILTEKIREIKDDFKFIIVDCPPSLSIATLSALTCADFVIIPIELHEWSAKGSNKIREVIEKIKKRANPDLKLLGYVISKFDIRRKIENEYFRLLKSTFGNDVFETVVKISVKYPECAVLKNSINYYLPRSEQAEVFRELTKEIIERINEKSI